MERDGERGREKERERERWWEEHEVNFDVRSNVASISCSSNLTCYDDVRVKRKMIRGVIGIDLAFDENIFRV